jgi:hypothetical protein
MAYHLFYFGIFTASMIVYSFGMQARQRASGTQVIDYSRMPVVDKKALEQWDFFYSTNFVCSLIEIVDIVFIGYLIAFYSNPAPTQRD